MAHSTIPPAVRAYRGRYYTHKDIAERLGVCNRTVYNIEKGLCNDLRLIRAYLKTLGCELRVIVPHRIGFDADSQGDAPWQYYP